MSSIKISFGGETRRVQLCTLESEAKTLTYEMLLNIAQSLFPQLRTMSTVTFFWNDDENDVICCSSTEEVEEAMRVMGSDKTRKTFKFDVSGTVTDSESNVVHTGIRCDNCGVSPITGVRYKCAVREDFDLCSKCEGSEVQPYAMIKIYSPEQAPAAIFVALKDGKQNLGNHREAWKEFKHQMRGKGCGGRGGGRCNWGNAGNNGTDTKKASTENESGIPPGHPGSSGSRFGRWGGGGAPWCHGRKNWRQHAEDTIAEVQAQLAGTEAGAIASPFLAAADAFAKSMDIPDTFTSPYFQSDVLPSNTAPENDDLEAQLFRHATAVSDKEERDRQVVDQQLLDEAMRQSLEEITLESGAQNSEPSPETSSASTIVAVGGGMSVNTKTKPKARFVRDVTFPDGTSVFPGAVLRKTWRIRNDGNEAWPEGVTLVSAGGDDLLSHVSESAIPVPSVVNAGDEFEISAQLTVPDAAGRYVAYFRLSTAEGSFFGQRMWADLRVTDEESEWQVVSGLLSVPSKSRSDSEDNSSQSPRTEYPATHAASEEPAPEVGTPRDTSVTSAIDIPPTVEDLEAASTSAAESPEAVAVWTRVWATELALLRDMGFDDPKTCFPLLQKHVGVPVSLCSEMNGVPPAEGIQRVVAALLGQSASSF